MQRITNPDGSWVISALDVDGLRSIVLRPYGSAPPATVSPTSTTPYDALEAVAAGQSGYVYTAEYITQSAPTMGIGSVSGRLLSYERYIGNTLVEKKLRPVGSPDFLETWNGAERLYKADAGWDSVSSSTG